MGQHVLLLYLMFEGSSFWPTGGAFEYRTVRERGRGREREGERWRGEGGVEREREERGGRMEGGGEESKR